MTKREGYTSSSPPCLQSQPLTSTLLLLQAFFDGTSTGELLTRLTVDVSRLSTAVADNLGQRGVRSLFEVSGSALMSCCGCCCCLTTVPCDGVAAPSTLSTRNAS